MPVQHSRHCFDSLLQYIMCGNSGDTLLYTWGRNQTGDGQLRRCIDWNSRKNWAKANTACYKDGDHPIPLYDHFNHCENDDDGIRGVE
jgi:Mycotoxin biosynthesis protein UstYa